MAFMRVKFCGGVRNVTGSKHIIETDRARLLVDCGLFQGHRRETYEKNKNFPFDISSVNAVVIGHAHIDHSGNIPNLVRLGYKGPIYATKATAHICQYMLLDSAYLQEKDIEFLNKKQAKKGLPLLEPIYTVHDTLDSLRYFVPRDYNRYFKISEDISVKFVDAGHILGSALTIIRYKSNSKEIRLGYIVDLGRKGLPLLRSPVVVEGLDYIIIESTYGNRTHNPISGAKEKLKQTIIRTHEKGGKLIVPSFALERTQELLYYLHDLYTEKSTPQLPIYVDSPLAINLTSIYAEHLDCLDKESRKIFLAGDDPFGFKLVRYLRTTDESKALNSDPRSSIIISASGMAEGGRILHHLKNNISDPKNTIMIVGFMAENTLGRKLVEREPVVKIFGEEYEVKAEIVVANEFSAHADKNELINYIKAASSKGNIKRIFLVHGEDSQANGLLQSLQSEGFTNVCRPEEGDIAELY